jgi:hypothetical protein
MLELVGLDVNGIGVDETEGSGVEKLFDASVVRV